MSEILGPHFCLTAACRESHADPASDAAELCADLDHWERFDDADPAQVAAHVEAHRVESPTA